MISQILWWCANLLIAAILYRSFAGKFTSKYPYFYIYIAAVLSRDLIYAYIVYFVPGLRGAFYWHTEALLDVLAYLIILEIYELALEGCPGIQRLSRGVIGFSLALVSLRVLYGAIGDASWRITTSSAELARDLRIMQAAFLLILLGIVVYYSIPLGRNLIGIILGYGLYAGVSVMDLAFRLIMWEDFRIWWVYVDPAAYLIALVIWSAMLWKYYPNPISEIPLGLQRDYEKLSEKVAGALSRALNHIGISVRS